MTCMKEQLSPPIGAEISLYFQGIEIMMCGHYRQVSAQELKEIRKSRKIQESLVYSDTSEPPYGEYLSIGVYWQAIDFLLNRLEYCDISSIKDLVFGGDL
ncbi:MAG: DUF1877 family protein [Nostocaceae cyanobacterium]|nr:DUF1877 family protein [Nostocaceae cyanobacterium]